MSRRRTAQPARANRPAEGPRTKPDRRRDEFVARPFEGLADESQWVALRELVPAATAPLALAEDVAQRYPGRALTLVTVLPMAWAALTRRGGKVLLSLQRNGQSGDLSRDLGAALAAALEVEPDHAGGPIAPAATAEPGPRLQELLTNTELDIEIHERFDFWRDESADDMVAAAMERANAAIFPTAPMRAARSAYWCQFPERAHVRWVLAEPEDTALAALARLAAAGELNLGESTKFAGMFRAHGLLVPVWDLPREAAAELWEEPVAALAQRYAEALSASGELDSAARRARHGLLGRAMTLR